MAQRYTEINEVLQEFITQQHLFFVGTAASDGRINVSPKGMDTFRIINKNKVVWLNLSGSGNETAAHLIENDRITLMFCAFEGKPLILRLYGYAKVYHDRDSQWADLISLFPHFVGARQVIEVEIDLVQTSCGFGVPRFDFVEQRDLLTNWAEKKGSEGLKTYWKEKNQISLDGKPTKIFD
jgi:predicted pyridoxine 5'-phosphate oxidase superfamily flavin-nucleotide-binding protein